MSSGPSSSSSGRQAPSRDRCISYFCRATIRQDAGLQAGALEGASEILLIPAMLFVGLDSSLCLCRTVSWLNTLANDCAPKLASDPFGLPGLRVPGIPSRLPLVRVGLLLISRCDGTSPTILSGCSWANLRSPPVRRKQLSIPCTDRLDQRRIPAAPVEDEGPCSPSRTAGSPPAPPAHGQPRHRG